MAHVEGPSTGRQTNVEPNLVPFIDLMSVCIIFLLVTAVWTQVSVIELGSNIYGKKIGESEPVAVKAEVEVAVNVISSGYILSLNKQKYQITKLDGEYDTLSLFNQLKAIKEKYPELSSASISVDESLSYNEMIVGMDVILNAGISEVSVATQ